MNKFLLLILVLLSTTQAYAVQKLRLAVLTFSTANLPDYYAGTVRDRIEVSLYRSKTIELLERDKIQLVLKENNLTATPCTDDDCAVKLGKLLSATHVVVGSVANIDRHTVTARVVDVARGTIVYADYEGSKNREGFAEAAARLADRIRVYMENLPMERTAAAPLSPYTFTLTLGGGYAMPVGRLAEITVGDMAWTLTAGVENVLMHSLNLGIKTGYVRLWGRGDIDYAYIVPFMATAGYTVNLPASLYMSPSLSGGGVWNYLREKDTRTSGMIETVLNPSMAFGYRFNGMVGLHFCAEYYAIFEKDEIIQMLGFGVGIIGRW